MAAQDVKQLLVHWAVEREDPDFAPMPQATRVVQVGLKAGWPRVGTWYGFACGRSWMAAPAYFVGTRLVCPDGTGDWPYTWCLECQSRLPLDMPRFEKDWTPLKPIGNRIKGP